MTETTDPRQAAIERLEARREFWMHLFIYVAVNTLLIVIWYVTNPDNHFWPIWPIAGWAIGLGAHAVETFRRPISEAAIQKEIDRVRPA